MFRKILKLLRKILKQVRKIIKLSRQFVIFKPLSHCFEEIIEFDVKASFTNRPVPRLIR